MDHKPLPPAQYFIEKLRRMRKGMLLHMGEASNEASVIANFTKLFSDGFLQRARLTDTPDEFFEAFGEVFVLYTKRDNAFVQQCLDKAIDKMRLSRNDEFFFKGNMTDALMKTNMGYQPVIKHLILVHRPVNWKTPKEMTEREKLNKLAEKLNKAYEKQSHR